MVPHPASIGSAYGVTGVITLWPGAAQRAAQDEIVGGGFRRSGVARLRGRSQFNEGDGVTIDGNTVTFTLPSPSGKLFARLKVTGP